ncbi:MAG: 2,3-bisphosphoglycerate-independent phosphoglycerate mutase [Spirochaetia bacterium]|nr:2,3-bisphosphoglycerate-independent phosphoglycerate mutase [Spirochaetia bacterium]
MSNKVKKVILMILDGFGINPDENDAGNAVKLAHKPNIDKLFAEYPSAEIFTSGENVGLPEGQMGNSEIGHLNLGSGRIMYSDIVRITKGFNTGHIERSKAYNDLSLYLKKGGRLHLMCLLSDGGVHSLQSHLERMLEILQKDHPQASCFIHAFLDGRDTPPKSAAGYIEKLNEFIKKINYGTLATIIGRYYAMDRDNRWDRIKTAYELLTEGKGIFNADGLSQIKAYYEENITDEFMEPILVNKEGTIKDNDAVIFLNFRTDRVREITRALTFDEFTEFQRDKKPDIHFVCMTQYHEDFNLPVLYAPLSERNLLGEVIANENLRQLRIAETEKYAHVTFFFNGGSDTPYKNEDRILVPSPDVATYDQKPQMSAYEVKEKVLEAVESEKYELIVINFANGDMVGHTGKLNAAIKAVEVLDECVGEIISEALNKNYSILLTADHGNCEKMLADDKKTPFTQHTVFNVPLVFIDNRVKNKKGLVKNGRLCDIAPTILNLIGIPVPEGKNGMTGDILISKNL